jgi:hypothetical protein
MLAEPVVRLIVQCVITGTVPIHMGVRGGRVGGTLDRPGARIILKHMALAYQGDRIGEPFVERLREGLAGEKLGPL